MVIDFKKKGSAIMPLKIDYQIIEQVSTYKYLGVTIDEKLHSSGHMNNAESKAKKRPCFVMLGQFKAVKTLITLSYSYPMESILSFCITCWGGNSSKIDHVKVDRIIRILGKKIATHVSDLIYLVFFFFLHFSSGDDFAVIQQEIIMMKGCKHPNIVAYFGSYLR